jgi:putative nucleotidyltransferase with HDIG domain
MNQTAPKMSRYLPQALVATSLVVGGPVVAVWVLRSGQLVGSTVVAIVIGVVLSIAASFAGSLYWANSESSRDVLFSELMIWGWLRRWRAEHKLTAVLHRLAELPAAHPAPEAMPQLSMLKELAAALEAGDPYVRGHSRRVARYASMIAERMGLAPEEVDCIRTAAAVHDVGKVRTPIEVLHKPGRLTDEEYAVIKEHPVDGAHLVEALGDDGITAIVRHHHERLDGHGYPSGLSGDAIPLGARIVAVADTFDAITSARPYRPASPHRTALDILTKEAGTQLDANAVRAFRACYTGRRPFAMWVTLLAFPQRLTASLGNGTAAAAVSLGKVMVAASTVAVVGGAAASASPPPTPASPVARVTATVGPVPQPAPSVPTSRTAGATATAPGAAITLTAAGAPEHRLARRVGTLTRPSTAHSRRHARKTSPVTSPAPSSSPTTTASTSASAVTPVTSAGSPSTRGGTGSTATSAAAPTTTTRAGSGTATKAAGGAGHGTAGSGHRHGKVSSPTSPAPGHGTGNGNAGGDGSGAANGNGNANGAANGNGNANGTANGNGNANGTADGNGNGSATQAGAGTSNAGGNANGNAAPGGAAATGTTSNPGAGNGEKNAAPNAPGGP